MLFGSLPGLFDLAVGEPTGFLDSDRLFLVRRLVFGGDVQDAVDIDVEGDLDLRDVSGGRWNAVEIELAELPVVVGHLAFALEDLDGDGCLVVGRRRKDLAP